MIWARLKARFLKKRNVKWYCSPCQVPIRFAILAVKRCISAAAFGRMAGVLTSIDRSSSTFLFWNENMIFSWRILMRVVILILPVVLGWVSGVATPSRDACRGYSVGRAKFNSYRRMHAGFLFFLNWRLPLCFDTIGSPDVSGLASDEAAPVPVARGGRSDCRVLSSFLILFWTCVTHVHYLYRVWAFFYILIYLFHRMCRVEYPTRRHWHRLPALDIQIDGLLPTYVRRLFFVSASSV